MNRLFVILVALLLVAGAQLGSAQQAGAQAEKLLAVAQRKATVEGDLKGAIEEYKKVVAAAGANRGLAAQALLRMAECHQKLGDLEAQAIYERLVRDYADQKDAAVLARSRLNVPPAVARIRGDRSIWSGPEVDGFGTISTDGRFLTYTDWKNNATLMLRDLTAGTNHVLASGTWTQFSAISKDGRLVAYESADTTAPRETPRSELRIGRLNGTTMPESRRLFVNDDVRGAAPFDWSPDGKWIAVHVSRKDLTNQIGLIAASDGSLRVLRSLDWNHPTKILFSPDGRFIAYDLMLSDSSTERHVFVMAVDGSRETTAVAHPSQNVIMGWSPDGRHLLFSSDRSGSVGLWGVRIDDGKAHGTPTLLKPDIASTRSVGLTSSGTMYVWKYASPIYVQTSAIDLTAGKLIQSGTSFQKFIGSRGRPAWSADGKYLAYQSCAPGGAGPCTLWIRSMETGELRELRPKLGYFFFSRFSPDGRELLTRGRDLRGRNNGVYRIDLKSGDATLVPFPPPGNWWPEWAGDGQHAYYVRQTLVIERHLATGVEREVGRIPPTRALGFGVSPDGLNVAYSFADPAGTEHLFVMPLASGMPRSLLSVGAGERLIGFHWTDSGRALAVSKQANNGVQKELWLVPVTEEKPRKLDVDTAHWKIEDGFAIDPAGKQIAFVAAAGNPGFEIRALENFLPAPLTSATAKK